MNGELIFMWGCLVVSFLRGQYKSSVPHGRLLLKICAHLEQEAGNLLVIL